MKKKAIIICAAHKEYTMPKGELYLPLQVGAANNPSFGWQTDNIGENISGKNPYFCDLTGLYWAWKNLDADYLGLVHYRRYFAGKEKLVVGGKTKKILSSTELQKLLEQHEIILPKKRNYLIETLYSHYQHTMHVEPLDVTGQIIAEKYPAYLPEFNQLKRRKTAHMFNMFIMQRRLADEYCTWLFDILFELEKRVDANQYAGFHARFYGRVSELLLDVWLRTNHQKFHEIKVVNIEKTNWWRKGISFLRAKFGKVKYEKSF
ncbi:MAG: DUF4422 domain-containing protein [Prevotella sp.]|nr:DUF4422 domain-containing protein [Prevotella sp.]